MKLLLTGATGAAGSQILLTALADPEISSVTVLARRELPSWLTQILPPKSALSTVVTDNFTQYDKIDMGAFDACVWALGRSSNGMNEAEYTKLTYDYTLAAATAMADARKAQEKAPPRFVFISGEGADQSEKSMMLFGRIKGRTEAHLLSLRTPLDVTILRPGYFFPSHPVLREHIRPSMGAVIKDATLGSFTRTLFPNYYTSVEDMAKFALAAAKGKDKVKEKEGSVGKVFNNKAMRDLRDL
ncbi:hypothetical protein PLICRDRAFT_51498 [Plicaturopsis crispa FD-325 SS-3]|nr:hypothetical protein PLICRDRAFT_51498 [Plicaturopsis crispa FD-325 SS-3]